MKKTFLLLISAIALTGCDVTRHLSATANNVSHDTIYLSNQRYDSVYRYESHTADYHMDTTSHTKPEKRKVDTLYVKDKTVEYRYRMLRDTVSVKKVDTSTVVNIVEKECDNGKTHRNMQLVAILGIIVITILLFNDLKKSK